MLNRCSILVWAILFLTTLKYQDVRAQMPLGGRLCSNGNCVVRDLWCDGVDNCGDNSDEDTSTTCTGTLFCCRNTCGGKTLATDFLCDGSISCGKSTRDEDSCCTPMCPDLADPTNGGIDFTDGNNLQSAAIYSCNEGFTLNGDMSRTCQNDQVWSGNDPSCEAIVCSSLTVPANGDIAFTDGNNFGSIATYSCDEGFTLSGGYSAIVCLGTGPGVWSGSEPRCEECPILTVPANGDITFSTNGIGTTATYTCDVGFSLSGDMTRTCQGGAMWSGSDPTCEAIMCPGLTAPDNGDIAFTDGNTFGSIATYSCDEGFTLSGGDSAIVCLGTGPGVWSGSEPTCEDLDASTKNKNKNKNKNKKNKNKNKTKDK